MYPTETSSIHDELERLGFNEDQIDIVEMIHDIEDDTLIKEIKNTIRDFSFKRLMKTASETWEKNNWTEEKVFEMVENVRKEIDEEQK